MILPLTNQTHTMKLPEGKNRLDLVREGLPGLGLKKRGRLVVGIERLKEDPRNERRTFRNMDGLVASIKAVGLETISSREPAFAAVAQQGAGELNHAQVVL